MNQLKSKIITDINAINDLKKDWDNLFERSQCDNVFLHSNWALTFISKNRLRGKAVLVTVWDGDILTALLPLDITKKFGIKTAYPIGNCQPSYLGILADEKFEDAVKLAAEVLRKEKISCLVNENLSQFDDKTFALMEEFAANKFSFLKVCRNICHYIKIEGTYEEYLQKTKSSKRRKKLKYEERRLLSSGDFKIKRYLAEEVDEQILRSVAHIQQESWMKRRGAAVIGHDFYKELLEKMSSAGFVEVWLLSHNGEDVAFVLSLTSHDHFNYYRTAFKLDYESKLSVGKVLTMCVIRNIFKSEYSVFDFGHGDAEYKSFWGTSKYNVYRSAAGVGIIGLLVSLAFYCVWKMARVDFLRTIFHKIKR